MHRHHPLIQLSRRGYRIEITQIAVTIQIVANLPADHQVGCEEYIHVIGRVFITGILETVPDAQAELRTGNPILVSGIDRQGGGVDVGIVAHTQDVYIPKPRFQVINVIIEVAFIQHTAAAVGDHGLVEDDGQRGSAE